MRMARLHQPPCRESRGHHHLVSGNNCSLSGLVSVIMDVQPQTAGSMQAPTLEALTLKETPPPIPQSLTHLPTAVRHQSSGTRFFPHTCTGAFFGVRDAGGVVGGVYGPRRGGALCREQIMA